MAAAKAHTSPKTLTCLQDYLNQVNYRPRISDMPTLNQPLLARAKNCIKRSRDNNDLLEFLGDRVLNLMSALIVEKVKVGKDHHTNVRRVICNNDTFGRLAFYLRLHEHAKIDPPDVRELDDWNPLLGKSPPKALADLFEAYAGAVYIQHGWNKLLRWLRILFEPIIKVATADWWNSPVSKLYARVYPAPPVAYGDQRELSTYLYFKRDFLTSHGRKALNALPPSTYFSFTRAGELEEPHCERMEVAVHLINMWICKAMIRYWPEYHRATSKAAHLATNLTKLIVSDLSLSYLGYILSLTTYFQSDSRQDSNKRDHHNDGGREERCQRSRWIEPYISLSDATRRQLGLSLQATVGWFYYTNPESADAWGEVWFRHIVIKAHDILAEQREYRPILPPGTEVDSLARQAAAVERASAAALPNTIPKTLSDFFDEMESSSVLVRSDFPNPDADTAFAHSDKQRPRTDWRAAEESNNTGVESDALVALAHKLQKMDLAKNVQAAPPCEYADRKPLVIRTGKAAPNGLMNTRTSKSPVAVNQLKDKQSQSPETAWLSSPHPATPESSPDCSNPLITSSGRASRSKWRPIGSPSDKENNPAEHEDTRGLSRRISSPFRPDTKLFAKSDDSTMPESQITTTFAPVTVASEPLSSPLLPPGQQEATTTTSFIPRQLRVPRKSNTPESEIVQPV